MTKQQKIIAVIFVVLVMIGSGISIYFLWPKFIELQTSPPTTTSPPSTSSSPSPPGEEKIYIYGLDAQDNVLKDKQALTTISFEDPSYAVDKYDSSSGSVNKGVTGCWSLDTWPALKINDDCRIGAIQLPSNIKATTYSSNKNGSYNNICVDENELDIIPPGKITDLIKAPNRCGFKFEYVNQ